MLNWLKSDIKECSISWKAILGMLNQFKVMENKYIDIIPIWQYEMATKWEISG